MRTQPFIESLVKWMQNQPAQALLIGMAAYLGLLLVVLVLAFFLFRMIRRQNRLLRGSDGLSVERMLLEQADSAREVRDQMTLAARNSEDNAEAIRLCLQRVGLVRYDAFADVGGEQSFSLALLDSGKNGLVVSGLYSRNDMRVYAKPVVAGGSPMSLTEEEQKAIASANVGGPVTVQTRKANGRGTVGGRR